MVARTRDPRKIGASKPTKSKQVKKAAYVGSAAKQKLKTRHPDSSHNVLSETLSTALDDIVETLVAHPDRILLMQHFVHNEKLYKVHQSSPESGFLHPTLIYMSGSTKTLWRNVLVRHSEKTSPRARALDEGRAHGV